MSLVDKINDYEAGLLSNKEMLELFADLIKTGTIHSLQGSYQRQANFLVGLGLINRNSGDINWEKYQLLNEGDDFL